MSFHCFTPPFRQSVSRLLRFSQDNLLVIEDVKNPQPIAGIRRRLDKARIERKDYKEGRISGAYLSGFAIISDSVSERRPNRLDLARADRHKLAVRLNAHFLGFSSRRHSLGEECRCISFLELAVNQGGV